MGQTENVFKNSNSPVRWLPFQKFGKLHNDNNKLKLFRLQKPKSRGERNAPNLTLPPSVHLHYQKKEKMNKRKATPHGFLLSIQ